jgi:hypothetical protein
MGECKFMREYVNPFCVLTEENNSRNPPKPHWEDNREFKIYWDPPDGIDMDDPLLPDPRFEKFIREVGVQNIVDAIEIQVSGAQICVGWNGSVLGQLIPEQRQVIVAHLAHILCEYFGCDSELVKDYIIKARFHYDIQMLANLEEEPGGFV